MEGEVQTAPRSAPPPDLCEDEVPELKPGTRRSALRRAIGYVPLVVFVTGALLVITSLKPYRIISGSMAPTADVGQRVFADKVGDRSWQPKAGDIIVFKAPGGARDNAARECARPRPAHTACLAAVGGRTEMSFVKRVVGLPGDRLQIVHGHVIRNGAPVPERYARSCDDEICELAAFTVPAGRYFVLGDNRGDSSDSRYWGPISRDEIIGRIVATYWPPRRIGSL